jgi:hypothetical protein
VTLFSLLLRVVLCVSLIANGAGVAQASARMQFEHAGHVAAAAVQAAPATTATVDASTIPPCHRHAAQATQAPSAHAVHAVAQVEPDNAVTPVPAGKKSGDDCCKGKTCTCACAHASCATTVSLFTHVVPTHDVRVPALAVDHPQPRLPHLIRPPIG